MKSAGHSKLKMPTCPDGHQVQSGKKFCTTCGVPMDGGPPIGGARKDVGSHGSGSTPIQRWLWLDEVTECTVRDLVVLGGYGFHLQVGDSITVRFRADQMSIRRHEGSALLTSPMADILELGVSGPGAVTADAGLMGGGFGFSGAAKGIAAAGLINSLTRSTQTLTFLSITTAGAELHAHYSAAGPEELRLDLAPAICWARVARNTEGG